MKANDRITAIRKNPADPTIWWIGFIVLDLILCAALAAITSIWLSFSWALIIGVTAVIISAIITIYRGWVTVPENHEMIVELNGEYMATWKSGLHIALSIFGLMKCRELIDMAETNYPLFFDDPEDKIDFHDASTKVKSSIHFRVIDSLKATYAIDDFVLSTAARLEGALRATCGLYNLDEANMDKHLMDLPAVIIYYEEVEKMKAAGKVTKGLSNEERVKLITDLNKIVSTERKRFKDRLFFTEISDGWGVEVTKLTVSDIEIPEHIQQAREKKLVASEEFEAAQIQKKTTVLNAEADAEATVKRAKGDAKSVELQGNALAKKINSLAKSGGITPQEAKEMIVELKKWESLGDKTVVLENALPDSMLKKFVELGILAQTGSNIAKS